MTPTVLVVMGVAGVGKTTVGRALADQLGWDFLDADDLHPPANVAKMARGEGLTDADRAPWLEAVRALIGARLAEGVPAVLACSALKQRYRRALAAGDARVRFVWLDAPAEVIAERLVARRGHFAGDALLPGQLDALEPPSPGEALRVAASGSPATTVRKILDVLGIER